MTDEQIVQLFFERAEGAIEALKEQYGSRAMAVAVKILGDREDAEEVVSDALHALWQQIPPARPLYLWAYFSRVVRNLSCDRLDYRNAARRMSASDICFSELEGCIGTGDDPQTILESKRISQIINEFLEGLDRRDRIIFVRRYYYFDACRQIGQRVGMTQGAVNTRLHRLRGQLRAVLEKEDIEV